MGDRPVISPFGGLLVSEKQKRTNDDYVFLLFSFIITYLPNPFIFSKQRILHNKTTKEKREETSKMKF